ncbi:MAG: hypothetical protein HZA04_00315 [Nitrospinae bacterium]|nr:hypothetical protein [Nitrospinota bacterium]
MKKLGKNVFEVDLPIEEGEKIVRRLAKDEMLLIRLNKKRKAEIRARAAKVGIPMTDYLLAAEDFYARVKGK